MPYKRKYVPKHKRNKKQIKRGTYPRQKFKFKKGLMRSVVPFTREKETYCRLDTLTGLDDGAGTYISMVRTDDGGIVGRIRIRLNNLPDSSDFTNLFKEYKLNYLKLTFIPAGNVAQTHVTDRAGTTTTGGNKNVLIRVCLNRTDEVPDASDEIANWSQLQAKKQWVLVQDRPTTITCKLSQLKLVQRADSSTTYTIQKPQYISTDNTDVNHYGLTLRFDSLDGTPINDEEDSGDLWPKFRIISKVYFTCKGVA